MRLARIRTLRLVRAARCGAEWLATTLPQGGGQLHSGDVVLTGGLAAAVPIGPGDVVEAVFGGAAEVRLGGTVRPRA